MFAGIVSVDEKSSFITFPPGVRRFLSKGRSESFPVLTANLRETEKMIFESDSAHSGKRQPIFILVFSEDPFTAHSTLI